VKVLIYGYYDDFANFFLNLRDYHRCIDQNAEYYYLTPNISGYITWNDANKSLLGRASPGEQGDYDYQFIEAYNTLSGVKCSRYTTECKLSYIARLLNDYCPDVIIISGDSRPNSRIIKLLAEANRIRCLYFEQGPLGTTLLSLTGVTANHIPYSRRRISTNSHEVDYQVVTYNKKRWQRYADIFQMFSSDPEAALDLGVVRKKLFSKKAVVGNSEVKGQRYRLLFALQVPDDINSLFHGPFSSAEQVIRYLGSVVTENVEIVVREHPMYKGSYDNALYEYINNHPNLVLDKPVLGVSVEWSKFVGFVTINSLMTFEAVRAGVPVAVLGRSCYGDLVTECYSIESLKKYIDDCKNKVIPNIDDETLSQYLNSTFFKGHFRNPTKELLAEIVEEIRGEL
jgi:capsular polysaccharide export protein